MEILSNVVLLFDLDLVLLVYGISLIAIRCSFCKIAIVVIDEVYCRLSGLELHTVWVLEFGRT